MAELQSVKLVVIGDGAVGKTCLLIMYLKREFPKEYVPTVFDNWHGKVKIGDEEVNVNLWDTAGQEDLSTLRTLSYPDTDVFLVCFSVVDPASYDNVSSKWLPELKEHATKNPTILLVGTKTDLRDDNDTVAALTTQGLKPITPEMGRQKAAEIDAVEYVECSALKNVNIKEVFDKGIAIALSPAEKGCCSVI